MKGYVMAKITNMIVENCARCPFAEPHGWMVATWECEKLDVFVDAHTIDPRCPLEDAPADVPPVLPEGG